jgi:hypothetical protein
VKNKLTQIFGWVFPVVFFVSLGKSLRAGQFAAARRRAVKTLISY